MKILYKSFFLLLPLLLILVFYLVTDPFKVLRHYDTYFESGKPPIVILNKDYVSTETFLNNYQKYNYDSYIFGSSRSMFYRLADWEPYIHSTNCYHFDGYKESIYGVYLKLKLLKEKNMVIKNALLVLDTSILEETNDIKREANLYMKDPALSGSNKLFFQYQFIKAFFDVKFCIPYIDYKLSGRIKPYMRKFELFAATPMDYNVITNEVQANFTEHLIDSAPDAYYNARKGQFRQRNGQVRYSNKVIYGKQASLLNEIHNILQQDNTNCKIIISPMYGQDKINPEDLAYLQQLFGKENVFDFSGKNGITDNVQNYYDEGHYRPNVARYLLSVVYGGKN